MNEAARIASELTLKALSSLQEKMNSGEKVSEDDLLMLLSADTRGMIKEAQDRAHGTPKQALEHTSPDGSMSQKPTVIELVAKAPDDDSAD